MTEIEFNFIRKHIKDPTQSREVLDDIRNIVASELAKAHTPKFEKPFKIEEEHNAFRVIDAKGQRLTLWRASKIHTQYICDALNAYDPNR